MVRKKDKKKRSKAVLNVRGGFIVPRSLQPTAANLSKFVEAAVRKEANRIGTMSLKDVANTVGKMKMPDSVTVGKTVVGIMKESVSNAFNNGATEAPFRQSETSRARVGGSVNYAQKRYKTTCEVGKPSTKSVNQYALLNGTTTETNLDTRYDTQYAASTTNRNLLSLEAGFNQKQIASFFDMHVTVGDIHNGYDLDSLNYVQNKIQRLYGLTKYFFSEARIMNTGSFFNSKVKIKLYASKSFNNAVTNTLSVALPNQTEIDANTVGDSIPLKYALGGVQTTVVKTAGLVDPKVSLDESPEFAKAWEHARTFSKTLAPGEVWDWKLMHHCGSGFRLDVVKDRNDVNPAALMGYLIVIEHNGTMCEAVNQADQAESFIGTSPSWLQVEFKKGHQTVLESDPTFSATSTIGGVLVTPGRFQIKAYSATDSGTLVDRITNFDINEITNRNEQATGVYIPVLSDSTINYAREASEQSP